MNILIESPEDKDALIDTLTHQCVNLRSALAKAHTEIGDQARKNVELCTETQRLTGEAGVMRALLRAAYDVIDTVDGESAAECEALMGLQNQIKAAFQGSK